MSNPLPSGFPVTTGLGFDVEQLEQRTMLSGAYSLDVPQFVATSADLHDVQKGPFTKGGAHLAKLYTDYRKWQKADGTGDFTPSPDVFVRRGDNVEVSIRTFRNLNDLIAELRPLDIQVYDRDAKNQM